MNDIMASEPRAFTVPQQFMQEVEDSPNPLTFRTIGVEI